MKASKGLNFSIAKYRILGENLFIPHIRSNLQASVQSAILAGFNASQMENPVALVKIVSEKKNKTRIKKLSKLANSLGISLKEEKSLGELKIEVLDIKDGSELQKRQPITGTSTISVNSVIPQFTRHCSLACEKSTGVAPTYLFENGSKAVAGSYLSRKDVIFNRNMVLNETACATIGLYFADGGKIAPSFTNSQPKIINTILDFLESISDIKRESLTARINCNQHSSLKKEQLENFWTSKTGITTFASKLHISKNVKSPCGILELNLGSKIIKELICNMFDLVFTNNTLDTMSICRGLLCGDGSPIKQNEYVITHHIATDPRHIEYQERFIRKIFNDKILRIKKINDYKIVLYNDWRTNSDFLLCDPYRYHIPNRLKFAEQFLSLKATRLFMSLKDGDVVKGIDISKHGLRPVLAFAKAGYISLNQISPKPNKQYEIRFTKSGNLKKTQLREFIKNTHPLYKREAIEFKDRLQLI